MVKQYKDCEMKQKFELGPTYVTAGVSAEIIPKDDEQHVPLALDLHSCGHYGEMCEEDKKANEDALKYGGRMMSAFTILGKKVWIITSAVGEPQAYTTVLFPEEY